LREVGMSDMESEGEPVKRFQIYRSDEDGDTTYGERIAEYDSEVEVLAFRRRADWHYIVYETLKPVRLEELQKRVWTCELCGQSVINRLGSAPILPSGFLENCKLRDHMIGDECIARRDLKAGRKLIKE
jgi:hypothetical protein